MRRAPKDCARWRFKSQMLDRWMNARSRFNRLSIRNTNHPLLSHWGHEVDRLFWWRIGRLPRNSPRRQQLLQRRFPDVF